MTTTPGIEEFLIKLISARENVESELAEVQGDYYQRIADINNAIQQICTHPKTERKSYYSPGSYLDREEWEEWDACIYCKAKIEGTYRKSTGGYG